MYFLRLEGIVLSIGSVGFSLLIGLVSADSMARQTLVLYGGESYNLSCPNVFRLYLWMLPQGIVLGSWWLISNAPKGAKVVGHYVALVFSLVGLIIAEVFRLIHSELRLLCAVDAGIGAAIGYFTGNPLIGAVAGGLLGVVNYEIITIRVMKLAGAKSLFR